VQVSIDISCCVVLRAGRPAILYKSLPSLILPAGDSGQHGGGRQPAVEPAVAGPGTEGGPAVIPLKETLARRLSASMDCIDVAGANSDAKPADAEAAANATTSESQLGVDVDEAGTRRP